MINRYSLNKRKINNISSLDFYEFSFCLKENVILVFCPVFKNHEITLLCSISSLLGH